MVSYKFLALALFSCAAHCEKGPAIMFSEEPCQGKKLAVKSDGKCVLLPLEWRKQINGAELPEDVVCDFYTDEKCDEPLFIGMEDPGVCSFTEQEIQNQTVSVHCYDGSSIY